LKPRIVFHVVAVIVLAAAVAAAQSPEDKQKRAQTSQSQSRQSSIPSVSERETGTGMASGRRQHAPVTLTARETGSGMATGRTAGAQPGEGSNPLAAYESGVVTARETGSGIATGKRVSGDPHEYLESRNSAHATDDAVSKDAGKLSDAQSNPMYKDSGLQGSNPLYQGKDRTATPPSNNGPKPADYKDGEDGTSHTRPGNHKPAK